MVGFVVYHRGVVKKNSSHSVNTDDITTNHISLCSVYKALLDHLDCTLLAIARIISWGMLFILELAFTVGTCAGQLENTYHAQIC